MTNKYENTIYIDLPITSDIMSIDTIYDRINDINAINSCVLNADTVERITSPVIQLLIALEKSLPTTRNHLIVKNPSAAMRAAFADAGLSSHLEKWSHGHE